MDVQNNLSNRPRNSSLRLKGFLRTNRLRLFYVFVAMSVSLTVYSALFIAYVYGPFKSASKQPLFDGTQSSEPQVSDTESMSHYIPAHANAVDFQFGTNSGLLELSTSELRDVVSHTTGYFARDWSLNLGWNNMRYIIESAILQSGYLNRTLILPSFVYARACEYHIDVCSRHARTVNRNDALGSEEWRKLPYEKQQAFVIPLHVMIDIPQLRRNNHSIILMSEYLHLQGLDPLRERSNGSWDREYYHQGLDQPNIFVIPNGDYDPKGTVRVDRLPSPPPAHPVVTAGSDWAPAQMSELAIKCDLRLATVASQKQRTIVDWSDAKDALASLLNSDDEGAMQRLLQEAGWVVLHTWKGALGMDNLKDVAEPIRQIALRSSLHGFIEEYGQLNHDILLLEGEIHMGRKPGFLYFTSIQRRDEFANIVLRTIRHSEEVRVLAERLVKRMDHLVPGRKWMAAHMRRGDFVNMGWINEHTLQEHFRRIISRMSLGRALLERIAGSPVQRYDVPGFVANSGLHYRKPPLQTDPIYLATDERSDAALELFREYSVKLFGDLVTMEDRRLFGWSLLFTDVISLVEQDNWQGIWVFLCTWHEFGCWWYYEPAGGFWSRFAYCHVGRLSIPQIFGLEVAGLSGVTLLPRTLW